MALTIDAVTVANPVEVSSDSLATAATNMTYGGMKSYYHNRSANFNQAIHVITVIWDGLNSTELGTLRTQWQAAADAYVTFTFDDVELPAVFSTADEFDAIVYPESGLDVVYSQGYDSAGNGPILYKATGIFLCEPMSLV